MKNFFKHGLIFCLIGLLLYIGLYIWSETLVYKYTKTNRFFNIKNAKSSIYNYIIMGASHAMDLSYEDMNEQLEKMTGKMIFNLATLGGGLLPNKLILDYYFMNHKAKNLLYVIDSGMFYTPYFNEDRLKDVVYYQRAPFDLALAKLLLSYTFKGILNVGTTADYITGFSKINNQDRFKPDINELELRFQKTFFPTTKQIKTRIASLSQDAFNEKAFNKYMTIFKQQLDDWKSKDINVIIIKAPLPEKFYDLLPNEKAFDAKLKEVLAERQVPFYDFSLTIPEYDYYFDTDHLNRKGVEIFFKESLVKVMVENAKS